MRKIALYNERMMFARGGATARKAPRKKPGAPRSMSGPAPAQGYSPREMSSLTSGGMTSSASAYAWRIAAACAWRTSARGSP